MPAIKFDGVGDGLQMAAGACLASAANTMVVVTRFNAFSVWHALVDGEGSTASNVTGSLEGDNGAASSNLVVGTQSSSVTATATTAISSLTPWYGSGVANATTTSHTFIKRDLTANTAAATETSVGLLGFSATAMTRIFFGLWNGTDDFNGWLAAAAWFNGGLSAAQLTECFANRRTSDIWNCSFGRPAALWECNVAPASVVDLTGGGANWVATLGNPALDGAVTPDWTFDGIGAASIGPPRRGPLGL